MTKVFCKIDGKLAVFNVDTPHVELARQTVSDIYQAQGAVLAVVK